MIEVKSPNYSSNPSFEFRQNKEKGHYQLTGRTNKIIRITDNVGKLKQVMKAYDVTFPKADSFFNIISKRFFRARLDSCTKSK